MSNVMVRHAECWECMAGHHFDPPRWHSWADDEDEVAAVAAGQPDPSQFRCACPCADEPEAL